jgi:outer membrane protein assembly factor BamB
MPETGYAMKITVLLLILAANWPNFRGPSRQGVVADKAALPVKWSASENLLWRTELPGAGWSSPIVWSDRIFLTTADDGGKSCRVLSLDRKSGRILWNNEVFQQVLRRKENRNSYATPTPATDGTRVYAVFGDGSIAAVDFTGKTVWTNRDFQHYSQHGLGASPVLHRDLLIMSYDGSNESGDLKVGWQKPWDKAFIVALDTRSGKVRWKAERGMSRIAHVTANIVGNTLVSGAGDVVQGFDLNTGKLLWTAPSQGEGVVPSVVIGEGLAFTSSGFERPTIRAVRTGGSAEIVWEQTKGVPKIPSFVYSKPYLFTVAENGIAMCLKQESGDIVWQERLDGEFSSSPLLAGDRVYAVSDTCETVIFRAGPKFEILGRNQLSGRCQASPAAADGVLYLRSDSALHAIGPR